MKKAFQFAAILTLSGLITMSESEAGRKNHSSGGSYGSVGSAASGGGSYGSVGSAASSGDSYGSHGSTGKKAKKSKGSSGGASSGGYGSVGSASSGGASTGSASSGGSSGRVKVQKVKVRRVRSSSHGSAGSTGSTGSHGGSTGSGSHGGSYGTSVHSQPVYYSASTSAPTTTVASKGYAGYALLVVNVPETASVYLDGKLMQTTGETRKFKIPVRTAGQSYAYPVRVETNQGGTTQVASYTKAIAAGKMTVVDATSGSSAGSTRVASL